MMERLTSSTINVILTVKEGRDFDFCKYPILVEAGLENNILDASLSPPSQHPQFCMEFLWETTKQAARRLRTAKVPIKLEFFSIINNKEREKIGFVLVNLSGAYIAATVQDAAHYPKTWHKLIMNRSAENSSRPEIFLGLRIESGGEPNNTPITENTDVNKNIKIGEKEVPLSQLKVQSNEPIVQMGPPHMATDLFSLEIICNKIHNFETFLSSQVPEAINDISLVYKILGTTVQTQQFEVSGNNEAIKTCLNLRSNVQFLYQYVHINPSMQVQLAANNTALAHGEIDISKLIPTNDENDFLKQHGLNGITLTCKQVHLIPKVPENSSDSNCTSYPYIDVALLLVYCDNLDKAAAQGGVSLQDTCLPSNDTTCKVLQAAGEVCPKGESVTCFQEILPLKSNYRKPVSAPHIPSPRVPTMLASASEPSLQAASPRGGILNQYLLEVAVENVLFHKLPQHNFFFKFSHSKADISPPTVGDVFVKEINKMVCLENIKCKFKFMTTAEEISKLLIMWPPSISICTHVDNQIIQLATTTLDTGRLLVEKKSGTFSLPLIDTPIEEEIGSIYVSISLEELDSSQNEDATLRLTASEGGIKSHDEAAYGVIQELQIWKERQEEIFKEELMEKEKQHLNALAIEFKKKRDALVSRLQQDLLQCQTVIQTLQATIEENRTTTRKQIEMEAELKLRQEELERRYKTKFQDLRMASKRMEDDLQHRRKVIEREKEELLMTNEQVERENALLMKKLSESDDVCKQGSLSREQITSLLQETKQLQEKLKEANESKALFKEQWAKAVREIHKIKCDHQEAMQIQIRDFKKELQSLGFQRLLEDEDSELNGDEQILQEVPTEVGSGLHDYDDYTQKLNEMFPSHSPSQKGDMGGVQDEAKLPNEQLSRNSSAKLQQLIRERDALLQTGNFSMDDPTVDKLNKEIRKHILSPCLT